MPVANSDCDLRSTMKYHFVKTYYRLIKLILGIFSGDTIRFCMNLGKHLRNQCIFVSMII